MLSSFTLMIRKRSLCLALHFFFLSFLNETRTTFSHSDITEHSPGLTGDRWQLDYGWEVFRTNKETVKALYPLGSFPPTSSRHLFNATFSPQFWSSTSEDALNTGWLALCLQPPVKTDALLLDAGLKKKKEFSFSWAYRANSLFAEEEEV